jgi:hypothetical protein
LGFQVSHVGSRSDGWLWDVLHVVFYCIHVVYVAQWVATAVPREVARFSAVEAWPLGAGLTWGFLLWLGDCCIGVHITAGVLSVLIQCSSVRYIHRDLYIVIGWAWCVGGVVRWSLLLLLLWMSLLVLLTVSPGPWLELVLILTEGIVIWLRVWESSSGPDEFDHLSAFSDVDSFRFVFSVCGQEQCSYDLI